MIGPRKRNWKKPWVAPANGPHTTLTMPQVYMILRIYWTDRYRRQAIGLVRSTRGLRGRLAKQFGVSEDVIKKTVEMRDNKKRNRFKSIKVQNVKATVKHWIRERQ